MKRLAIIPLVAFDLVVNIYLNILFLIPLKSRCSNLGSYYSNSTCPNQCIFRPLLLQTHAQDGCECSPPQYRLPDLCGWLPDAYKQYCVRFSFPCLPTWHIGQHLTLQMQ